MYCTKKITSDLIWLGGSDRRLALFENVYPIPRGVSYNAYLIQDEKTALLDTVDQAIAERFFENLEHALQGKPLNYVIVNHMEPDHAATLGTVLSRYPEATVIGNAKTLPMIKQFFPMEVEGRFQAVKEGDTLSLGRHELTFVMAPLVHWPEVMMTYDTTEKALFSADAFGTFGAMDGNIFADEVNFEQEWLDDARRYYTNIVGKYGTPVQNVLKKAAGLDIQYLCPLHGPIWRENIGWFLEKYKRWSTYTPEAWTAAIFCGSIYGHTENACEILASRLAETTTERDGEPWPLTDLLESLLSALAEDPNNEVWLLDSVMRLAPTVGYAGGTLEYYNAMRTIGAAPRKTLTGDELTLENIRATYDTDADGHDLLRFEDSAMYDAALRYTEHRINKLTLSGELLETVSRIGGDRFHVLIGIDDSSSEDCIQKNEIAYLQARLRAGDVIL